MDDSMEQFLSEYFQRSSISMMEDGGSFLTSPPGPLLLPQMESPSVQGDQQLPEIQSTPSPPPQPSKNSVVGNFDLGASQLFADDSNASAAMNEDEAVTDTDESRILSVRASRKSISYNIVFNRSPECKEGEQIAIRIHSSTSRKVKSKEALDKIPSSTSGSGSRRNSAENSAGGEITPSYVRILEKDLGEMREKNKGLEEEVKMLKERLGQAHKTIGQLEIEVANFYCQ